MPRLLLRFELQFVATVVGALNSRNTLTRESVRALVGTPDLLRVAHGDVDEFLSLLRQFDLVVSLPPHRRVGAAARTDVVRNPYEGGTGAVFSDGLVCGRAMGWGAVVLSSAKVLGTTSGGLVADCPSSWAAEWVGKMEGALLAARLGIPAAAVTWYVADNRAACLGVDGGAA